MGRGYVDPYDPAAGGQQTLTIAVKDSSPVTAVTAVVKTDHNTSTPNQLKLTSGTATDGQWAGTWTINDSYLYTYNLVLTATSARGQSTVEITLR